MIPEWGTTLVQEFNPNDLTELFNATVPNLPICIALGFLQMTFSWPDAAIATGGGTP